MALKNQKNKGFTLVEILVSVAIFSSVVVVATNIFTISIAAQRKILAQQEITDQVSYAVEYIGRAIRMAQKETSGACLSSIGSNYQLTYSGNGIKFNTSNGNCWEFWLDTGNSQLMVKQGSISFPLSSPKIKVTSFKVQLAGEGQGDNIQPKVTLFLTVKGGGDKPEAQPEIEIQTTVSQRNFDIAI